MTAAAATTATTGPAFTAWDVEKGTAGGFGHVVGDGSLSFGDLLDAVNPLQHVPVVSSVYRAITGDTIKPAMRVAGGLLYGGPIGALGSAGGLVAEQMLGGDPLTQVAEAVLGGAEEPAPAATPARQRIAAAEPASRPAPPATAKPLPPTAAKAVPAHAGRNIQAYIRDAMPARTRPPVASAATALAAAQVAQAPVTSPAAPAKPAATAAPAAVPPLPAGLQRVPPWFADRMLGALDKYREQETAPADHEN